MELAQIVLLLVVIILTGLLIVLGIQVYFILKELRKTVGKLNRVLDNAESITESVAEPMASLSSLMTGLKTGATVLSLIKGLGLFTGKRKEKDGRE